MGWASVDGCCRSSKLAPLNSGSRVVRLETNRTLIEAVAMYRTAGYVEVDAFNDEPYAHHWFEKHLSAEQ